MISTNRNDYPNQDELPDWEDMAMLYPHKESAAIMFTVCISQSYSLHFVGQDPRSRGDGGGRGRAPGDGFSIAEGGVGPISERGSEGRRGRVRHGRTAARITRSETFSFVSLRILGWMDGYTSSI